MLERVLCLVIGYVFGMFQTAVLYGKMKGVDIRSVGSGNAGTTNTLRVMGTKAGLIVLLGDMLKCILAIVVTYFLFSKGNPEYKYLFMIYTAAGCVLGHDFPFFLKFKGGKGIACTAGYIISMGWQFVLVGLVAFFVPFNITHFVSVSSLCLYTVFFIQTVIFGQMGLLGALPQSELIEIYIIVAVLTALAFYQHRGNIQKLISKTERKTYLTKKNKID
ncbi:MAG: glycerol-3-phosphate 1-O-acyltransferase PlsY [Butyrivibrio sp.]|nr:glycerol-3-phosphate 1-O-acyltransferase PlsY [Butyrivibrio sp.]